VSKSSRLKHEKPEFEPVDRPHDDDELCSECGFFVKLPSREICGVCEEMEHNGASL
jgi:hypothetical protein